MPSGNNLISFKCMNRLRRAPFHSPVSFIVVSWLTRSSDFIYLGEKKRDQDMKCECVVYGYEHFLSQEYFEFYYDKSKMLLEQLWKNRVRSRYHGDAETLSTLEL